METPTYNLNIQKDNSKSFYDNLKLLKDKVLESSMNKYGYIIDDFIELTGDKRNKDEILIDLLSIGVYWKNYIRYGDNLSEFWYIVLIKLADLKRKLKRYRKYIDKIIDYFTEEILLHKSPKTYIDQNGASLDKLLKWMDATGEFGLELKKLKFWREYSIKVKNIIPLCIELEDLFCKISNKSIGKYMGYLDVFLRLKERKQMSEKNSILSLRKESEYYLNLFAAEVINSSYREKFINTKYKKVLLPTCMAYDPSYCEGDVYKGDIKCTECSSNCNVSKVMELSRKEKFDVHLISYSYDVENWLKKWENQEDIGIVMVTCILHLIPRMYKMEEMGIPCQTVFLDHSGCKKHWSKHRIPTSVSLEKIKEIIKG